MTKEKRNEIFIIVCISILVVLPFIRQAYHIDDWVFLTAAEKYNASGFQSINGTSTQDGMVFPNYYITHPLLYPLFLSVIIKIFHAANESILHLISIFYLAIIGFSSLIISRRYSKQALWITAFVLGIPAVMLMSHLVMSDIPTLAFFLLALALHFEGVQKKSVLLFIFSGIAAVISIGFSYQALFIILLLIFYNVQKKTKGIIFYLSVIIPAFCFIIWSLFTWEKFGIPHPFVAFVLAGDYDKRTFAGFFTKLIGNINSLGAAGIFPVFVLLTYLFKSQFRNLLFLSFTLSLILIFIFVPGYSLAEQILFSIYFTAGIFILLRITALFIGSLLNKNSENLYLSAWFLAFFFAVALLMPLGISRYLLPAFLPLIIIVVNDIKNLFELNFKIIAAGGIAATMVWGILCSTADYNSAGIYRQFAQEMKLKYGYKTVWFSGDSGFKWYMEKEGFNYLLQNDDRPKSGDIVIIPQQSWPININFLLKELKVINKIDYPSQLPVKTMNLASHAGFYAELNALLPFSITRSPYEIFSIYEVMK
jgi:4-amino-4-deoxy-L-arabinose transferase-like glycosyltransferase